LVFRGASVDDDARFDGHIASALREQALSDSRDDVGVGHRSAWPSRWFR
jgi:hypothetical protein